MNTTDATPTPTPTTATRPSAERRRFASTARRRASAVVVAALLTASAAVVGAAPASAHARCDGQTHNHYYWTGNTATWTHSHYVTQRNRFAPDVTWAVARSSHGETHMNRCFW